MLDNSQQVQDAPQRHASNRKSLSRRSQATVFRNASCTEVSVNTVDMTSPPERTSELTSLLEKKPRLSDDLCAELNGSKSDLYASELPESLKLQGNLQQGMLKTRQAIILATFWP